MEAERHSVTPATLTPGLFAVERHNDDAKSTTAETTMDINTIPYQQHLPRPVHSGGQTAAASASTSKPVFEFTKRKKWDDLLLSEIHLTILFILSLSSQQSSSKILFTGYNSALSDVLGYNETELVDSAFGDIMNERDGQVWQSIVDDAVRAHNPGTIGMFVRLKRKPPPPPTLPANPTLVNQFANTWPPSPTPPTPPSPTRRRAFRNSWTCALYRSPTLFSARTPMRPCHRYTLPINSIKCTQ